MFTIYVQLSIVKVSEPVKLAVKTSCTWPFGKGPLLYELLVKKKFGLDEAAPEKSNWTR